AYGVLDVVDVGLPPSFYGLMSAGGGPFFYVVEVMGWRDAFAANTNVRNVVIFRNGAEVMNACIRGQ
ncbi:MAG: hypothetical protein HQL50_16365, partial [Magnetococcales bacterium]|nr:hypothetical protein [Magnetococcales bacterium]